MTTAEASRLAVVVQERRVRIVKVAYSLEELSSVTGESKDALRRRIHNGSLAARHTGRRYVVSGPAVLAAGLWNARTLVDYRDVIDPDVEYSLGELGTFLDLSYYAARRLVQAGRIKPADGPTMRVKIRGAELLAYLGGCDDPMQHPESA
jgi:hypothetical protein